jgi:hypothetical protein
MKEKVIDIYPPSENDGNKKKESCVFDAKKKKSNKGIFIILFLILFLGGYFYYVSFKTEVLIYPITKKTEIKENVLIRTTGSIGENEIRGVVLSEKVSDQRKFDVEGRRMLEKKTKGEIKVCQDYRDSTANFVEGTRFISDEGKIFFATSNFSLPSKKINEGCDVVEVIAAEPGEDYNIPANSKFALPGLHGSTIYGNVKGVSFTIKEEGILKEVPYLDDDSMQSAENQMKEDLFKTAKEIILEKYGEEYLIESDTQYVIEVSERDLIEESEDTFYFKLDVTIRVITVAKKDIDSFISNVLPEYYVWRKDTEEVNIGFTRINFNEGEADIFFEFSGDVYQEVDKEYWARELKGLDFEKARMLIEQDVDTEEIVIRNRPFGLSKVASSQHRVDVNVQFDKN